MMSSFRRIWWWSLGLDNPTPVSESLHNSESSEDEEGEDGVMRGIAVVVRAKGGSWVPVQKIQVQMGYARMR